MRVKYMTKEHLLKLRQIEKQRKHKFNQAPSDALLDMLGVELKLPVVWSMVHNDVEMRAIITVDDKGSQVIVDMPFEMFNALPQEEIEYEKS